ncbi:uncharacterized protein LOC135468476 [Liolophura sinensis]|uniref:uncharacterized protein LOC135468476 n=1 Tax=Liolophura sinensis TaxID=3198878 RepID=UPI0031591103
MAGMKMQSVGSSLSVNDEWPNDMPKLSRSISTISLSSTWSVTSKLRAFGFTKTVKQKCKHGFGGTNVFKVKTMQGMGSVHTVKKGLNNDVVTQEINRRVEEMKLKFRQSRLEVQRITDLPAVESVLRKNMRDPSGGSLPAQGAARKDSIETLFKNPMFWSNFLRGVYPNSLPIDELADKDEIRSETYDTTRSNTNTELDAFRDREVWHSIQSSNIASDNNKTDDLNTGSDLKDNKETGEIFSDLEGSDNDLSDASHQEDVWGPLCIPEGKSDMFRTESGNGGLEDAKYKGSLQPGNQPNGLETLSYTSANTEMFALRNENSDIGNHFKGEKLPDGGHPFVTRKESLAENQSDVSDFKSEYALPAYLGFRDRDGYISDVDSEVNSGDDFKEEHDIRQVNDSGDEIRDKTSLDFDGEISLRGSVGSDDEVGSKTKVDPDAEVTVRESGNSDDEVKLRGKSYSFEEFVIGKEVLENSEGNWSLRVYEFGNVEDEKEEQYRPILGRSLSDVSKTSDVLPPYSGSGLHLLDSTDPRNSDSERSLDSVQDGAMFEPISTSERIRHLSDHRDMYASVHDLTAL